VPVVGPDDSYYFPQVGSPFVHDRQPDSWPAPPPAPYILTVSHAGQGIVTQDVDVHADQPTDFVDIAGDIADRDHDDIPDCWEIANPPFSPDDSTDADIPPSISSVTPTSGIQGDTISSLVLTGSYFQPESTLFFEGSGITIESQQPTTSTRITASISIAADAIPGPRDVIVTNPHGQRAAASFQVEGVGCAGDSDCDRVPDEVDRCSDTPPSVLVKMDGCPVAPVIFIPGIMGSRLYTPNTDGTRWLKLWEPTSCLEALPSLYQLTPAEDGESRIDVYTLPTPGDATLPPDRGLIDVSAGCVTTPSRIYIDVFEALNRWLGLRWQAVPYDWRLNLQSQLDRVDSAVNALAPEANDRVTIIAHSLGGLLAKYYVAARASGSKVDTLILVASPQVGTPKTIDTLLHGRSFTSWWNWPLLAPYVRSAVSTMHGVGAPLRK